MEDTIVGVATAAGEGGIAIVRISGESAVRLFEQVFIPFKRKPPFESHRLMAGRVLDGGEVIDEAMGVAMYAPNSYARMCVKFIPMAGASRRRLRLSCWCAWAPARRRRGSLRAALL